MNWIVNEISFSVGRAKFDLSLKSYWFFLILGGLISWPLLISHSEGPSRTQLPVENISNSVSRSPAQDDPEWIPYQNWKIENLTHEERDFFVKLLAHVQRKIQHRIDSAQSLVQWLDKDKVHWNNEESRQWKGLVEINEKFRKLAGLRNAKHLKRGLRTLQVLPGLNSISWSHSEIQEIFRIDRAERERINQMIAIGPSQDSFRTDISQTGSNGEATNLKQPLNRLSLSGDSPTKTQLLRERDADYSRQLQILLGLYPFLFFLDDSSTSLKSVRKSLIDYIEQLRDLQMRYLDLNESIKELVLMNSAIEEVIQEFETLKPTAASILSRAFKSLDVKSWIQVNWLSTVGIGLTLCSAVSAFSGFMPLAILCGLGGVALTIRNAIAATINFQLTRKNFMADLKSYESVEYQRGRLTKHYLLAGVALLTNGISLVTWARGGFPSMADNLKAAGDTSKLGFQEILARAREFAVGELKNRGRFLGADQTGNAHGQSGLKNLGVQPADLLKASQRSGSTGESLQSSGLFVSYTELITFI